MKNKMFKTILALVMVLSLLVGCSLTFVGCKKSDDEGAGNSDNQNNAAQYEGLEKEEYLQKLESNNLGSAVDSIGKVYDKILGGMSSGSAATSIGTKLDLTLSVGDDLLDMLEQNIFGGDIGDMSFLSKINLNMDMSVKDQMEKMQMALSLNGQKIITLNLLMNMADYVVYGAAPDLNDGWIKFDMGAMMPSGSVAGALASSTSLNALFNALPDGETLTKVLDRYLNLVLAGMTNVDQKTSSLEAGGVRQEVTELTLKIYEEDAMKIVKSVLTTAKDDADLKKIFEDVAKAAEDLTGEAMDTAEIYADFQEAINDMLADMEEETEFDTENPIVLSTYVDKDHNIIGRKVAMVNDGEERNAFYYYSVTDGDKTGFDMGIPDDQTSGEYDFRLKGSGWKKDGKNNGDYTLTIQDEDWLIVKLQNVDAESGTVILDPTAELEKEMGLDEIPFKSLYAEIKLGEGIELNIMSEQKLLVGLALKATESDGPALSEPSNATDATDSSAMQSWAEKLVLDKVLDNLEKAGVPSELINALESGNLFGGSESSTEYPAPYAA